MFNRIDTMHVYLYKGELGITSGILAGLAYPNAVKLLSFPTPEYSAVIEFLEFDPTKDSLEKFKKLSHEKMEEEAPTYMFTAYFLFKKRKEQQEPMNLSVEYNYSPSAFGEAFITLLIVLFFSMVIIEGLKLLVAWLLAASSLQVFLLIFLVAAIYLGSGA